MRRLALAVLAVGLLAATAGCLGSGGISQDRLAANATYDWNTSANVSVDVATGSYTAVYRVSNATELSFSTSDRLTGEQPISISSVKFRYGNGTVVNASAIGVDQTRSETIVRLPNDTGWLAFTAPAGQRAAAVPVPVDGSATVVLPGGMDVAIPVLGHVTPGGYERTTTASGRIRLSWESVTAGHIEVNYYYRQDVYIFAGIVILVALAGFTGAIYLRAQIRRLRKHRENAGLGME